MVLGQKVRIYNIDSYDCSMESESPPVCYPLLFKSKFMLAKLVVHIDHITAIRIFLYNVWGWNVTVANVSKIIRIFDLVWLL